MRSEYLFTSESVSEGHPDKVADQISDAVVDLFLSSDPVARVACETMVTTQRIVLAGEVRSSDRALINEEGELTDEGRARIEACRPRHREAHRLRAGRLPLADRRLRE